MATSIFYLGERYELDARGRLAALPENCRLKEMDAYYPPEHDSITQQYLACDNPWNDPSASSAREQRQQVMSAPTPCTIAITCTDGAIHTFGSGADHQANWLTLRVNADSQYPSFDLEIKRPDGLPAITWSVFANSIQHNVDIDNLTTTAG